MALYRFRFVVFRIDDTKEKARDKYAVRFFVLIAGSCVLGRGPRKISYRKRRDIGNE
jgi:hypothetical protein